MKTAEYQQMIHTISTEVLQRNMGHIREQILSSTKDLSHDGKITTNDATAALMATCMTLAPHISAEITAEMLVRLGLVTVEDDD